VLELVLPEYGLTPGDLARIAKTHSQQDA
jgi:hypothetical protein